MNKKLLILGLVTILFCIGACTTLPFNVAICGNDICETGEEEVCPGDCLEVSSGTPDGYTDDYGDGETPVDTTGNETTPEDNQEPVAVCGIPSIGIVNQTTTFNGSESYDPDGTSLYYYYWTFGDGNVSTEINATHNYTQETTYTVRLTVVDYNSSTDSCNGTIQIMNSSAATSGSPGSTTTSGSSEDSSSSSHSSSHKKTTTNTTIATNSGCTHKWQCTSWNSCEEDGMQTRICYYVGNCTTEGNQSDTRRLCTYVAPLIEEEYQEPIIEIPEETCYDQMKNQEETGIDCGGPCKACETPVVEKPKSTWYYYLIAFIILLIIVGMILGYKYKEKWLPYWEKFKGKFIQPAPAKPGQGTRPIQQPAAAQQYRAQYRPQYPQQQTYQYRR